MKDQSASFEQMLTGGHPNSLGRTLEVVYLIWADQRRLEESYQYYFSSDQVVRLRTSNAMKRICKEHSDWLRPELERLSQEKWKSVANKAAKLLTSLYGTFPSAKK